MKRIWWHFRECGHDIEALVHPEDLRNHKKIGEDIYLATESECNTCHNRRVARSRSRLGPGYRAYED